MLKQLKYFQAVVRSNSFTEAAEECHISKSAISQQIQALENELGVKLLHRENRKFTVTPAGEHFYKKSLILTADFERLCRETARIANKEEAQLGIGYLKCYGGQELQLAVAAFSEKYPDVAIEMVGGNHEELYDLLRFGSVDLVLNDQRRAFSDQYVNFHLTEGACHVEIAGWNPIAQLDSINVEELKNIPCILIASQNQRDNELTYFRDVIGFSGEVLFAENLEEARFMVLGGRGFMPIEGGGKPVQFGSAIRRVVLCRDGNPIKRNYCAFWKADNSGYYIEEFADILKSQFIDEP